MLESDLKGVFLFCLFSDLKICQESTIYTQVNCIFLFFWTSGRVRFLIFHQKSSALIFKRRFGFGFVA